MLFFVFDIFLKQMICKTINNRKLKDTLETPADNGRFHASGGVSPQTVLWKFASASPARTFVNPRLRQAAGSLGESQTAQWDNVRRSRNMSKIDLKQE